MIVDFKGYNKKKIELSEYKDSVCKVIDDFIFHDSLFKKEHYNSPLRDFNRSFDFYMHNRRFVVQYYFGDDIHQHEITFTSDEYKRLEEFMKNPSLYKSTQDYNI